MAKFNRMKTRMEVVPNCELESEKGLSGLGNHFEIDFPDLKCLPGIAENVASLGC